MDAGMAIIRLERDEWDESREVGRAIEAPTLLEVQAAIQALDQERHTLLRLVLKDGAYMVVGGGRGDYIAYIVLSAERSVHANTERFTYTCDKPVRIIVGGQAGEYESRYVLTLGEAEVVALGFAAVGGLDSQHSWTKR